MPARLAGGGCLEARGGAVHEGGAHGARWCSRAVAQVLTRAARATKPEPGRKAGAGTTVQDAGRTRTKVRHVGRGSRAKCCTAAPSNDKAAAGDCEDFGLPAQLLRQRRRQSRLHRAQPASVLPGRGLGRGLRARRRSRSALGVRATAPGVGPRPRSMRCAAHRHRAARPSAAQGAAGQPMGRRATAGGRDP